MNGVLHLGSEESEGRTHLESRVLRPEKLSIDYDKENDVLYITVGRAKEADDTVEPQEGVVVRTRKGRLVGITIIGLRNYLS